MLIVGAKGFAKEVLEIIHKNDYVISKNKVGTIAFYDDVNSDIPNVLYEKFPVLRSIDEAKNYFANEDVRFTIGIGSPLLRKKMFHKFTDIGGIFTSTVSHIADIGSFNVQIGEGCNITSGVVITNDISIGKGCILNLNATVGHDSILEDFVEVCPNVNISGNCYIGENTFVGTSAVILPGVTIGKNCIIAAGAVVKDNIPDNVLVAGVPAVIKKNLLK